MLNASADVLVSELVADEVGDPGDSEMGTMLETTRIHIHETDIEKKRPSSVMGEEERDFGDRNTTRTHTHKTDIE